MGLCVFLGPNLISLSSKKQHTVSKSSIKAEFQSMAVAMAELIWFQSLFLELHIPYPFASTIYCDNQSAVLLAANPILCSKSKHFELDLHFV